MKHVGKMINNGAKIAVVYRTLPGDAFSALVVGTGSLQESYHDSLMSLIQGAGQSANELAELLAVRKFPDGSNMLEYLHTKGYLKKVPTTGVLMTPTPTDSIPLDQLNHIIAEQKGVTLDELAITDGVNPNPKTKVEHEPKIEESNPATPVNVHEGPVTAKDLRSMADKLFKEAQLLRKKADELEPPVKKVKAVKTEVE